MRYEREACPVSDFYRLAENGAHPYSIMGAHSIPDLNDRQQKKGTEHVTILLQRKLRANSSNSRGANQGEEKERSAETAKGLTNDSEDPNKGKFGESAVRNQKQLSASIEPFSSDSYSRLSLEVRSLDRF